MFPFVIVTGLSGAGKSFFLKTLEDLGYETIDNLPLSLLQAAVEERRPSERPLAIGLDIRSRHFSAHQIVHASDHFKARGVDLTLVFLDSDDAVLHKRYRETRRMHPLSDAGNLNDTGHLETWIAQERHLLEDLKTKADVLFDTSLLTPPEFKAMVRERFAFEEQRTLTLHLMSFAFREGIPREADMLFDMRFLKNPYYQSELKPLTGQMEPVRTYLAHDKIFQEFGDTLKKMLSLVLPPIESEGRGYFIIAFGCSGGQHRSVFTAEWMSDWLRRRGYTVQTYHRELKTAS